MRFAIDLPNFGPFSNPHFLIEISRQAEAAGWDGLFIWDHLTRPTKHDVIDPWIAMAAMATVTEKIRLGAMVTPIVRRRPWKLARETASLDHLSNGRLIFGAGLGGSSGADVEWANFGEPMDLKIRAEMLDEGLEILNGLWEATPFTFAGKHYQVADTIFTPRPVQQPRIPVWIAGRWPAKAPFRRAARWDGMFPVFPPEQDNPTVFAEALAYTLQQRTSHTPFDAAYMANPTIPDRAANAAAFARAGATWYVEVLTPDRFGKTYDDQWPLDQMLGIINGGPPRGD